MFQILAQMYTYSYPTTTTTSGNSSLSGGALAAIIIGSLVLTVVAILIMWKVFVKAGRPGWAAIIPIYNTWVLFEISGKPGWWALFAIVPYVGSVVLIILYIIAMIELAKRFGKSTVFAIVGMVLFSIIGFAILAFGEAKYNGGTATADGITPSPSPTPTPTPPPAQPPTAPQPPAAQ